MSAPYEQEGKVGKLIAKEAMSFQDEDVADISQVIEVVSPVVESMFPTGSPQHIFRETQRKYSVFKDKMQIRCHILWLCSCI